MSDIDQKKLLRSFMYKHPITRPRRAEAAILVSFVALFLLIPVLSNISTPAKAGVGPNVIDGTVFDASLNIVQGATVVVDVMVGSTSTVRSTQSTTTDSLGFYTVTFIDTQWEVGDTIKVTATKGSDSGTGSGVVGDDPPHETIDVTIGSAIPEFGSPVLISVAMAGIVLTFVISRRNGKAPVYKE